jgi:hypothetical protein
MSDQASLRWNRHGGAVSLQGDLKKGKKKPPASSQQVAGSVYRSHGIRYIKQADYTRFLSRDEDLTGYFH